MGRQNLFFGLFNLIFGIALYAGVSLYVPDLLWSISVDCRDDGLLSCGGLLGIVQAVAIIVSLVGLIQILYWVLVEKKAEEISVTAQSGSGAPPKAYKICPECNSPNDMDAKFCKLCGYDFAPKKA